MAKKKKTKRPKMGLLSGGQGYQGLVSGVNVGLPVPQGPALPSVPSSGYTGLQARQAEATRQQGIGADMRELGRRRGRGLLPRVYGMTAEQDKLEEDALAGLYPEQHTSWSPQRPESLAKATGLPAGLINKHLKQKAIGQYNVQRKQALGLMETGDTAGAMAAHPGAMMSPTQFSPDPTRPTQSTWEMFKHDQPKAAAGMQERIAERNAGLPTMQERREFRAARAGLSPAARADAKIFRGIREGETPVDSRQVDQRTLSPLQQELKSKMGIAELAAEGRTKAYRDQALGLIPGGFPEGMPSGIQEKWEQEMFPQEAGTGAGLPRVDPETRNQLRADYLEAGDAVGYVNDLVARGEDVTTAAWDAAEAFDKNPGWLPQMVLDAMDALNPGFERLSAAEELELKSKASQGDKTAQAEYDKYKKAKRVAVVRALVSSMSTLGVAPAAAAGGNVMGFRGRS